MKQWNNLKTLQAAITILSLSIIVGCAFGFSKYYGATTLTVGTESHIDTLQVGYILDRDICAWDSAGLVFAGVYLGLRCLWFPLWESRCGRKEAV